MCALKMDLKTWQDQRKDKGLLGRGMNCKAIELV